jgi:hypothetical protein
MVTMLKLVCFSLSELFLSLFKHRLVSVLSQRTDIFASILLSCAVQSKVWDLQDCSESICWGGPCLRS